MNPSENAPNSLRELKYYHIALVIASLFVYLEWGVGNHSFLFEAEKEVLSKLFVDPISVLHPFTVFPLIGQLMLFSSLLMNRPNRWLTRTAILFLACLVGFIFVVGVLSMNWKIMVSTMPFLILAILAWKKHSIVEKSYSTE